MKNTLTPCMNKFINNADFSLKTMCSHVITSLLNSAKGSKENNFYLTIMIVCHKVMFINTTSSLCPHPINGSKELMEKNE